MSTQINVIIDNGGLSVKARQQTQANRWAKLEEVNGQQVDASAIEQRASKLERLGQALDGQALGGSTAALRFQQEEVAANRGGGNGWLALPQPYVSLPFVIASKAVEGYTVRKSGRPYRPFYAADLVNETEEDVPLTVESDAWVIGSAFDGLSKVGSLYFATNAQLDSSTTAPINLKRQEFTLEAIARPGEFRRTTDVEQQSFISIASPFGSFQINLIERGAGFTNSDGEVPVYSQREIFIYSGALTAGPTLWVGEYYQSSGGSPANQASDGNDPSQYVVISKLPAVAFSEFAHLALVLKHGTFAAYYNGLRVASAPTSQYGWGGSVTPIYGDPTMQAPASREGAVGIQSQVFINVGTSPDLSQTTPLVRPAVKCVRFTPNRALYTEPSFTPPTTLSSLA